MAIYDGAAHNGQVVTMWQDSDFTLGGVTVNNNRFQSAAATLGSRCTRSTPFVIRNCHPLGIGFFLSLIALSNTARDAAIAAPASDTLLSSATFGFVSVGNPTGLKAKFDKTQIGQLALDETMTEFVEQLTDQINRKCGDLKERFGVTLNELRTAVCGEITIALIGRDDETVAFALTMNVSSHRGQLDTVLARIDAHLLGENARKSTEAVADTQLTVYAVPARGEEIGRTVVHFEREGLFVAVDNLAEARAIAERFANPGIGALSGLKAYQETQLRCEKEAKGMVPDVRWFIDPFKFDSALKLLDSSRKSENEVKEPIQILCEQGFDSIVGLGGYINLAVDAQLNLIHRTTVYAPPVNQDSEIKYSLAMQILEFPNGPNLQVERWVPRKIATYTTLNFDFQNGFDHVHTLFDAVSGRDGAFETTIYEFEKSPFGPQVNVRTELIKHLGSRVTILSDFVLPVTPIPERYLVAIEVKDPDALRPALERLFVKDPDVQRRQLNNVIWWEIIHEHRPLVKLGGLKAGVDKAPREEFEEREPVLQPSTVCLHGNSLFVGSDVEFLMIAIVGVPPQRTLAFSRDFEIVMQSLRKHASPVQSSWSFCCTEESVRPIYELLRAGNVPESNTFIGRLLNKLLRGEEEANGGFERNQQDVGKALPRFDLVRGYFGPAGQTTRSDEDGWLISGVVLKKAGR